MPPETDLLLAVAILIGATLYSSVGHGGSSAYIAIMALFGVPAAMMRPTALVLNLVVSSLASVRYIRAGQFRWRTLWPFLLGALPMAYIGGGIVLPGHVYRPLLGVILWLSAARLLWPRELKAVTAWRDPAIPAAIVAGAGIGMLSGLTGTGGGIFLSPLLLFMAWSEPKAASGVVAVFIFANSAAGLLGNLQSLQERLSLEIASRQVNSGLPQRYIDRQGFRIGPLRLLARFEATSELSEIPSLYRLPGAPAGLKGMANIHGNAVPVFDLATLFGVRSFAGKSAKLLIFGSGSSAAGVIIDTLPERKRFLADDEVDTQSAHAAVKPFAVKAYNDGASETDTWVEFNDRLFFDRFAQT